MPITRSQTALKVDEREAAQALLQLRKATMRPLIEETMIQILERILTRSGVQAAAAPEPLRSQPLRSQPLRSQPARHTRPPQRAAARRANQLLKLCAEADNE